MTESKALSTMLAIHEQVKAFVERECNCKVTSIRGSSSTKYSPPMGAIKLTSTAEDIRAMDFLLERLDASFMVDAMSLSSGLPGLEMSIEVGIVSNMANLDSEFVVMRRRGAIR